MPEPQVDFIPDRPLPSGTVTFFFSDIEGSTRRWERGRDAMAAAVARHDALMRAAIEDAGGSVFKTVGDGFCATFSAAPAAVRAALDAHRKLSAEDWSAVEGLSVRIALHTGDADERGNDYFGPAVNRVARLLATAHGGQTVVSGAAAAAAVKLLPEKVSFADLGQHRLKDLALPERVFQLEAPGLRRDFPPLRSLESLPNNLPRQPTSFVGRDADVAEIRAILDRSRLVTVLGTGGIGKSRVAAQVGARLLDDASDGTWFIELAPLVDAAAVVPAIARALGLELGSGENPIAALIAQLRSKRLVLILDNCEHLIAPCADVAQAVLRECLGVSILATSREPLSVTGEIMYRLPPLPVPPAGSRDLSADEALAFAGVQLFVDRAKLADARFVLTDRNATIVADICRRLDGIALAIELAAPRVKVLSVPQIRDRLDGRFKLLGGGPRDVSPRQQTLRALIDWSYDLLGDSERALFRHLGVFSNGCTLEAASAVASDDAIEEWEIVDLLGSLVDKSLVVADVGATKVRYSLLESIREYAFEKLVQFGERDRCARRHAEWCAEVEGPVNERLSQSLDNATAPSMYDEIDNIRAAIAWSEKADFALAVKLVGRFPWHDFGNPREGLALVERFEGRLDESIAALDVASLLLAAARSAETLYDRIACSRFAARGLHWAKIAGDPKLVASCQLFAIMPALNADSPISDAQVDATLAEIRASGAERDAPRLAYSVDNFELAFAGRLGRVERVRELAATMLARTVNVSGRPVFALRTNLAEFEHYIGATDRAIELIESVKNEIMASRDRDGSRLMLGNLAGYYCATGNLEGARASVRAALTIADITPASLQFITCLIEHLALVLAREGDHGTAARFAAIAERNFRMGQARGHTEKLSKDALEAILQAHLDPATRAALGAAAQSTTLYEAVAEALERL